GGSWADCSETETTVASLDYYYVRLKAVVGESFAGESTTVQVTGLRKEDIPAAAIDYEAETLTGLTASADYTINSTDYTSDTEGAIAIDASWLGTTLSIVKKGDNSVTCNSNPQSLDIPARPAAPTGVTGSVVKIKGTTLAMEYSETGVDTWADCSATATAVAAGSYDIRLKAVADESFAGTTTTVTVLVETIRYVKPGGAGSGDGSSWADAAASILPATLAVGDIIFVAAGTYTITTSLVINKEDVSIYGACAGTETSVSHLAAVPDTVNNPTVIQYTGAADGNGRVINATGINVLIQGFHITGGNQSSGNGGGIQIENGTIRYCTVYGNKAPNGGGIRVNNANATIFSTIENCIVRNNEATTGSGGGINISRNTTIVGCIIKNNTAGGGSGGIHTSGGGDEIIDRCVIDSNETAAGKDGGGLTLNKTLLTNSLIINNKSGRGGGMRIGGSSNVSSIYNCTIADNEIGTTSGGGAVSSQATSNIMKNCIVWNNKRNVNGTVTGDNINSISILSYSICNDAGGSDNTTADPLFTDAANGQYTIKRKSPARGAGDFSVNLTTDLIGTPRGTETIDIGAYEYLYPSWLPKETTPTVAINYVDEMLMRLTASADYFLGGTEYIANGPVSIDEAWFGTTLSIVKAGDEVITSHSEAQLLDIPARPAAPAVTGGIIKINGTTTDMEYVNAAGGSWASCSNGSTAVEEGDYFVRVKAIAYEGFSGESASIHVDGLTPEITPNVAIDYINETLINFVPLSEHQVSLTTFYSISEEGMIEIEPEWMGTTVMIVKNGDYVITSNSEPQWLEIPARPAAPAVTGGILQIEGTSAAMEYASAGGGDWADCSDGSTALAEGEYIVRVKAAADENFVGATVSVQVVGLTQEATPAAAIDYIRETLTGLTASAEYLIDGTDYTADAEGILSIDASWLGTTLSIVKKGDGASTYSSEAQSLVVPARPAAPTVTGGITQIEGTSAAMEYASAADGTWAPCSDGSTAVEAGEYLVRLKAVAGVSFAGATTPVRVEPVNGLAEVAAGKALFRYLPDAREIVVDNVTNTSIAVYDITGICIVRKEAATRISTAGWAKGVYIVKAGNKTAKLLVR
ncbi:MAG: hypothetical protein LBS46_03400, partial [Dysgonamonadaceae bacterium]|nr:hypothetical protein [Dysgonamonadaceae bacterium]